MLKVDCTGCAYCMPCPAGVNIPSNFDLYNDVVVFNDPTGAMVYNAFLSPEQKASACTECGECEEKCPQDIQTTHCHSRAGGNPVPRVIPGLTRNPGL